VLDSMSILMAVSGITRQHMIGRIIPAHKMKRMVVVAGFLALLATAIVAAGSYNVQPAKAGVGCPSAVGQPYGQACVSQQAGPGFGTAVSGVAHANGGLHDCRAAGDKSNFPCNGSGATPGGNGVGSGRSGTTHGNNG
jgi:hypothetical protein